MEVRLPGEGDRHLVLVAWGRQLDLRVFCVCLERRISSHSCKLSLDAAHHGSDYERRYW